MSTIHGRVGVAISTTGDPHRLELLQRALSYWEIYLPEDSKMVVTVDGEESAVKRVLLAMAGRRGTPVYQVGQPIAGMKPFIPVHDGRLGVAVNKNTGIELLMDAHPDNPVDHLFLSDDDTWPLNTTALDLHAGLGRVGHSMVNWGGHRYTPRGWTWPRGAVLYTRRPLVEKVGGMVEAFGSGGHEHVEWSRRIHQHKFTPRPYPAPEEYAVRNGTGAGGYWHAEDMRRGNESRVSLINRRKSLTSVRRQDGDWARIEKIMDEMNGVTRFVPYAAQENGRSSATLYPNH